MGWDKKGRKLSLKLKIFEKVISRKFLKISRVRKEFLIDIGKLF